MKALQKSKPIVKWDDVAGLETAKEELKEAYWNPKKFPKYYPSRCRGILLYGPPGTGMLLINDLRSFSYNLFHIISK